MYCVVLARIGRIHFSRVFTMVLLCMIGLLWLGATIASAAPQVDQPPGDVVSGLNLVDVLIGLVVPLVGYMLNYFAPWASSQAKAVFQIVLAAGVGAVHQMIGAGDFGWNQQTAIAILTVMGGALAGYLGYNASGIDVALGAGVNSDGTASTTKHLVGG